MAINYPNSLDNFTNPTSSSPINSPSHADQHSNANDAIEALEAKVGVTGSAVSTSHDYKITQLESLVTSAVAGAKSIYQDVRNQSGSSLSKATPVYASGSEGASGKILVSPASNSAESSSSKTIGLTSSAISNNSNGQIISEGILEGVDTTGAVDGDPVWLGPNGTKIFGLVNKPSAPSHLVFLGIVVRGGQANTGSIYVKIQNGFELQELHNVQISSLLNGNILAYDSTSETWKNTNTLQSTASTTPLVIKGSASQSVNIFEVQNASGYPMVFVDAYGALKAQASGMYVNSGYASGTGIVVRGYASQTANLQEWQNSSGTVLTSISSGGNLVVGATGTLISYASGRGIFALGDPASVGLTVKGAASQTANLQEWHNSAGTVNAFVTVGGFLGTNSDVRGLTGGIFGGITKLSSAGLTVYATAAGNPGAIIRGAASQTADLQQWQDSTGTILASISPVGTVRSAIFASTTTSLTYIATNFDTSGIGIVVLNAAHKGLVVRGAVSQTANLQEWQNSSGTMLASITDTGFSTAILKVPYIYTYAIQGWNGAGGSIEFANATPITIKPQSASVVNLVIKGAASQTANLQEWQNSSGTVLASISSTGKLTSAVDAEINGYKIGKGAATTGTSNIAFGLNALNSNTTGSGNFAIGIGVLQANTTGGGNFALGSNSLISSTTGDLNMALGNGVLYNNTTGYYNVGIGYNALVSNTTGRENMAIGISALGSLTTGALNTAVGQGAGYSTTTGNSNVFIGYAAGGAETGSNKLYIANTNTVTPLIGGDFSAKTLTFAGNATITSQNASSSVLIVKAAASQSNSIIEWQNSSGTTIGEITGQGIFRNTYNYVQNLQGLGGGSGLYLNDVTTTAFNTNPAHLVFKVQGFASQTANLQEWQNSSGYVYASIDSAGSFNLASGKQVIFNTGLGTRLNFGYGSSYVVGIDDYAIAFGVENSTGLGKIAVRPATATYGSSYINPIELYGNGQIKQNLTIPSNVGLSIKAANSQTANLQEWQDSSGNTLVSVQANGYIQGSYINLTSGGGILSSSSNQLYANSGSWLIVAPGPTKNGLIIKGAASQSADLQQWQNSAGEVQVSIKATSNLTNVLKFTEQFSFAINWGNEPILSTSSGELVVSPYGPERAALIVKGKTSQTDNLQEWQNSSGQIRASISSTGGLSLNYANSIKLYNTANTDYASLWMDNGSGGVNLYTKTNYPIIIGNTGVDNGANLTSASTSASSIPLVIQHAASPTSSYFEIRNSSGTAIWGINSVGEALTRTTTKFGANIQNDSSNNNTALSISAPSSGGTGIALYVYSGSATRDIAKFDNSGTVKLTITSDGSLKGGNSSTISANTATTVDTVALSSFTTIEYVVSIKQGSKIRSSKVLVHTDGTSVDSTEYGIMEMGGGITGILVTASVSSTNSILEVTITDAATTNATVKLIKTML